MQRYHFFRTNPIQKILSIGRFWSDPIPAQFFLNQCRIAILLCADLIITLLCVKTQLLNIDNLILMKNNKWKKYTFIMYDKKYYYKLG